MSATPPPHLDGATETATSGIPAQSGPPDDDSPVTAVPLGPHPTRVELDLGPGLEHSERGRRVLAQLQYLFPATPSAAADQGSADTDFSLRLAYGPVTPGWREIESWRVIPRRSAPRYLLPQSIPAARATVLSYNALRSARVAATRQATALAIGPLAKITGSDSILRLSVPDHLDQATVNAGVITQHLLSRVPAATTTAISLRDFHARAKPTVQLLSDAGEVVAFAKVASDPTTAERVLIEADLLECFGAKLDNPTSPIRLPRVLDVGRVGDFAFSIVAPLPANARRVGTYDDLRVLRGLKAFAESLGSLRQMPLAQTTLWDEVMARASAARAARAVEPDLVAALDALVAAAHEWDSAVELTVGAYHGDWVPWNMAWVEETLWVWDLEYGSPQGPFGLDALRFVYQTQHVTGGATFAEAVEAMAGSATQLLPMLGVPSTVGPILVRLHVIDTLATALLLLAAGRGMPEGLAGAVEVMHSLVPNR